MERIISEIKNAADKVAKKSNELFEVSKVKLNISNIKSEINNNYKLLGKIVYESQKNEFSEDAEKIEEIITNIDELNEKLFELSEIISSYKNEKVCPKCGKNTDKNTVYCPSCGFKYQNVSVDEEFYSVEDDD